MVMPRFPKLPPGIPKAGGEELDWYKQQLLRWMQVAQDLGYQLPEAPKDPYTGEQEDPFLYYMRQVGLMAKTRGVETLPWYKEITSKIDPAVFWQRQLALGEPLKGMGLREFYAPKPPIQRIIPTKPTIPTMPTAGEAYYPFLETAGMTPAMKQYYETRLTPMRAGFEAEQPGAREKWWEREKGSRLGFLGYRTKIGGVPVPKEMKERIQQYEWIAREPTGKPDPFRKYLEEYPFREKFLELDPRQRGYYPSRFAPPTRWLGF